MPQRNLLGLLCLMHWYLPSARCTAGHVKLDSNLFETQAARLDVPDRFLRVLPIRQLEDWDAANGARQAVARLLNSMADDGLQDRHNGAKIDMSVHLSVDERRLALNVCLLCRLSHGSSALGFRAPTLGRSAMLAATLPHMDFHRRGHWQGAQRKPSTELLAWSCLDARGGRFAALLYLCMQRVKRRCAKFDKLG